MRGLDHQASDNHMNKSYYGVVLKCINDLNGHMLLKLGLYGHKLV